MKKILLGLTVILLACLPAWAQSRWEVIPQGGVQISNVSNNADYSTRPSVGFRVGGLLDYRLSQGVLGGVSVQMGMYLGTKGFRKDPEIPYAYNSGNLEIPLLLSADIHLTRSVDLILKGGGYMSYRIFGDDGRKPGSKTTLDDQVLGFYCPYDYGIELGIGAEWQHFQLMLGSNIGMYDFFIERIGKPDIRMMNRTLHLTIGYKY